jgi:hypothetical protein
MRSRFVSVFFLMLLTLPASEAWSAVGGSAECVDVTRVICYNQTQRRSVLAPPGPAWDCEAAGLAVEPGDRVMQYVYGTVAACTPQAGEVTGIDSLDFVRCVNLSTGQRVYPATGGSTWDCTATGMAASPGQGMRMTVSGDVSASAVCQNGAVLESTSPSGTQMVCDDPTNTTCEEDAETLCPVGWNLCPRLQHWNRNDGWAYVAGGANIVVGEIYCRGSSGAGHYTLGPYAGSGGPLSIDAPLNCGYGSSRAACPAGYGCNELIVKALCCAPSASCGNGVVDSPEEECDDGNGDETDDCLNSCAWRVPVDHGLAGPGC